MAAKAIAIVGVQTVGRNSIDYERRLRLKTERPLLKFPVNRNRSGGLKPIKASLPSSPFNISTRVSNGVATAGKGMSGWHGIELMVRDYELDQYGVVNNGVYSNYCQIAHSALIQRIVGPSYYIDVGDAVALTELSLKFISPLKSGDRFLLRARISGISGVRLSIQDSIIRLSDQRPIMDANARLVFLDNNYKPVRVPREIRSAVNRFIAETESEQD